MSVVASRVRCFVVGALVGSAAVRGSPALAAERVSADIVAPARLDDDAVRYPAGARGDSLVVLEIEIEKDGTVANVAVKNGEAPFDSAARLAARSWRFSPATRGGLAIRARILAKVVFREPKVANPPIDAAPVGKVRPTPAPASPSADTEEHGPDRNATPSVGENPPPSEAQALADAKDEAVTVSVVGEAREEPGSTHIPRSETRLVPGAFADPFRVVEVLPGIAPILSGIPYFTIRGSPPGNVGYFIDGIRVPLLFHVGAGPSILPAGLIDRVDLFPSVYPARFGRSAGGIMAGETARPSAVARGEAQARIFDADGMIEQPFANGRGSILLGGRYGYTGALLSLVAPDYKLSYWDYQARLSYLFDAQNRVSVFSFGAYDFLENKPLSRTLFDVQFHRVDIRWDHDTDRAHVRLAATLASDFTLNAQDQENATDPGSSASSRGARLRLEVDDKATDSLRIRGGADIGLDRYVDDGEVRTGVGPLPPTFVAFGPHTDPYGGAWIDLVGHPNSDIEVVPSFRLDLRDVRGTTFVAPEPRVATRLKVAEGVAWISAFGVVHQAPGNVVPVPGLNISPFESGNQEMWASSQSIEVALPSRVLAKLTGFRNVGFLPDVSGRSHNYGAELFLHRDFTERLGGFISYTLSRADRDLPGSSTLSSFDRTHVLSTVLGYNLGKGYRVGARLFVESGRPYTVGCPNPSCSGTGAPSMPGGLPLPPSAFPYQQTGRFRAFSRLDVRFEKKWSLGQGASLSATFEWFNALLAREIDDVAITPSGLAFLGRSPLTLPSVGLEVAY